jgi:hypothetical protein
MQLDEYNISFVFSLVRVFFFKARYSLLVLRFAFWLMYIQLIIPPAALVLQDYVGRAHLLAVDPSEEGRRRGKGRRGAAGN